MGRAGMAVLVILLFIAVAAPWLAPYAPDLQVTAPFASPSAAHWLGADDLGQDILSQLLIGTRVSLAVGVFAALVATGVGTAVGLTAGVMRGAVDTVLMRVVDVVLTLPFVPLVIVLSAFAGPGFTSTIMVIGLLMWARTARVLRSQVLSARERGPATVARAMGAGTPHILWHHVFPSVFPLVVPELVRAVNAAILLESSLAFLGLGDPTSLSWGSMLYHANARSAFLTDAWLWWELPPGLCIGGTVLAFVLVGHAIEGRLRPRLAIGWRSGARDVRRPQQPTTPAVGGTDQSPARAKGAVLAVQSLHVAYDAASESSGITAVHDVSFTVHRGEVVGIVGESGSGKSTVLTAVMRMLAPNGHVRGGSIVVAGHDVSQLSADAMRRLRRSTVALVPQSAMNALNPVRTIGSQVREAVRGNHGLKDARARELLELVGIPTDRIDAYPHELSGGMRQRVVIAIAMANTPAVIIADEPTSGLDVLLQVELLSVLQQLRREFQVAVLLVSHDLSAVSRLADRVLVMHRGRIVEQGPTLTLLGEPSHPYTRRLVSAIPRLRAPAPEDAMPETPGDALELAPPLSLSRPSPIVVHASLHPLLELRGVSRSYGHDRAAILALDNVNLIVHRGECVGLIGASGAGKSTMARVIMGLTTVNAGRVLLNGNDITSPSRQQRRERARTAHMVFQDPFDSLAPGMRVTDIVREPCVIHGMARDATLTVRVEEALEAVGLTPASRFLSAFPHELSGGERQRVALARALMLAPQLIVADEPTSQLDAPLRADMVSLLRRLHEAHGTAYLYITHDIAMASAFCDRLVIMHQGRVVESGPTADVVANPREVFTQSLLAAVH